jgi:hypothetical protein
MLYNIRNNNKNYTAVLEGFGQLLSLVMHHLHVHADYIPVKQTIRKNCNKQCADVLEVTNE